MRRLGIWLLAKIRRCVLRARLGLLKVLRLRLATVYCCKIMAMDLQILNLRTKKQMCRLEGISNSTKIETVKQLFERKYPKYYPSRQSFRLGPREKSLKDSDSLTDIKFGEENVLYFKDLGPQISWSKVFFCEYSGPLVLYLLFYFRIPYAYSDEFTLKPSSLWVVKAAAACHTFHYAKRLFETKFIHRFSHGTMPIKNLFKNSSYYWLFGAWMSYFINHPQYTSPSYGDVQIMLGLAIFIVCELGNLSIHVSLRNLRPPGTKKRQIPHPSWNPFTSLFSLVSCPNYTYEVGSWIGFGIMTQTAVAFLFAFVGFLQMAQWALGKHRNYRKEFSDYPRSRKAIVPFLL